LKTFGNSDLRLTPIGTNLGIKRVIGNILQDEKFPGIHIAFGNPYGEHTGAPLWHSGTHIDGVGLGSTSGSNPTPARSKSCVTASSSSPNNSPMA